MAKYWAKHFRNVIFTGMPTAGKTTFGKIYALHSGRFFLDFDAFVEKNTKKTVSQIFETEGEEGFRILESKILRKLGPRHNFVFSMGGGTLLKQENFLFARKLGLIVFIKTPAEILARRILAQGGRPLFAHCSTLEEVKNQVDKLYSERLEMYEKADVILESDFNTIDTLKLQLELIERRVRNKEYMREVSKIMTEKMAQENLTEEAEKENQDAEIKE